MTESGSEIVVMPDMADPLASKHEVIDENEVSVQTGGDPHGEHQTVVTSVDGVPVSSAVASLINVSGGTASFNVITQEQLQVSVCLLAEHSVCWLSRTLKLEIRRIIPGSSWQDAKTIPNMYFWSKYLLP